MIWGNLIVFCIAIGIVCLVDFSTIALDEPTKRLLYLEIDDKEEEVNTAGESESSDGSTAKTATPKCENESSIPGVESEAWAKKKSEARKKPERAKSDAVSTSKEKSNVGMGLDFEDDFNGDFAEEFASLNNSVDTDSAIDEIYSKGGMK